MDDIHVTVLWVVSLTHSKARGHSVNCYITTERGRESVLVKKVASPAGVVVVVEKVASPPREEIRSPLKAPAGEAMKKGDVPLDRV